MVVSAKEQEITLAVIDACRRGDREAFRVLYEAFKDDVYSMALHFFHGDAATAADVTQQVFLKLMDRIGQFDGRSAFPTWLHRFVANACVDRTRSAWRRVPMADPSVLDSQPLKASHEDDLVSAETSRAVKIALSDLTPKIRMALVLRYFQDLSYAEMASVLNCSIGTVASRLSRGHELLAQKLGALGIRSSKVES